MASGLAVSSWESRWAVEGGSSVDVDLYGQRVPSMVLNLALLDAVGRKQYHVVRHLLQGRNRADPVAFDGTLFRLAWNSNCEPIWNLLFEAVADTPRVVQQFRTISEVAVLGLRWYIVNNRPSGMRHMLRFSRVVDYATFDDLAERVSGPILRVVDDERTRTLFSALSDRDLIGFANSEMITDRARQCILAWYVSKDKWFCADCGRAFRVEETATHEERESMARHDCICQACNEFRHNH